MFGELFQHDGRSIAGALRFQSYGFLADYAAMQQTTPILSTESNQEFDANVQSPQQTQADLASELPPAEVSAEQKENHAREVGGRDGLEPTRFGDWEKSGRCIDF